MDLSLANIDLNSNPYAGTEHDTNKSLRDFALERIMARREKSVTACPDRQGHAQGGWT
jgi:hypothetical protein